VREHAHVQGLAGVRCRRIVVCVCLEVACGMAQMLAARGNAGASKQRVLIWPWLRLALLKANCTCAQSYRVLTFDPARLVPGVTEAKQGLEPQYWHESGGVQVSHLCCKPAPNKTKNPSSCVCSRRPFRLMAPKTVLIQARGVLFQNGSPGSGKRPPRLRQATP